MHVPPAGLALLGLLLLTGTAWAGAQSFPSPGLWDPLPLDADVHAQASIGAAIAGAQASVTSRSHGNSTSTPQTSVQEGCSLQIASPVLPQNLSNSTIVLQSNISGSVIQVCR